MKNCKTLKEVCNALKSIEHSQRSAKKPILHKQLILSKMTQYEEVQKRLNEFVDIGDNLSDEFAEPNSNLLSKF